MINESTIPEEVKRVARLNCARLKAKKDQAEYDIESAKTWLKDSVASRDEAAVAHREIADFLDRYDPEWRTKLEIDLERQKS